MELLVERWNAQILGRTPKAKAIDWPYTDAQVRKRGDQIGLDTLVVHAVNDDHQPLVKISGSANALNDPPEQYARKSET